MKQIAGTWMCVLLSGAGCASAPPPQEPAASSSDDGMTGDAWRWFESAEWVQQGLEAGERWADQGPREVAVVAGLPDDAPLERIAAALRDGVAAKLAAAGGKIYVEVHAGDGHPGDVPTAGVAIRVEGPQREDPAAAQVLDAVRECVARVAGIRVFLQEQYAGIGRLRAAGDELSGTLRGAAAGRLERERAALADAEARLPASIATLTRIEARLVGALTGNTPAP